MESFKDIVTQFLCVKIVSDFNQSANSLLCLLAKWKRKRVIVFTCVMEKKKVVVFTCVMKRKKLLCLLAYK
jgi:hypothetical protein